MEHIIKTFLETTEAHIESYRDYRKKSNEILTKIYGEYDFEKNICEKYQHRFLEVI